MFSLSPAEPAQAAPSVVNAPGFFLTPVFTGLNQPIATRFAPDGRVFIAEKSGRVLGYDSLTDTTPVTVVDVSTSVHDYLDRGLLGLAIHPNYPTENWIYLLYSWDDHVPSWFDACPEPLPGQNVDGCVINGRLSRFPVNTSTLQGGSESVLISGRWCQQYSSHSIGHLEFGPDGKLYVSAGDGASYIFADYGQGGGSPGSPTPENPCGDPPVAIGGDQQPPAAQGGALRSQDLRTSGDPTSYDGTILRLEPTGTAAAGNPLAGGAVADDDAIIAQGLRNPYRFTVRPGTSELWIGDVGWHDTEEINRLTNPLGAVENFGWPCYEGSVTQSDYDGLNLSICEELYSVPGGGDTKPHYGYPHDAPPSGCPGGGAAISAISFYDGTSDYPSQYDGALFFGDYAYGCIRVMLPDTPSGVPNPGNVATIITDAVPVDLVRGPSGDLFYTDIADGTVYRLEYNTGPTAVAEASQRCDQPLMFDFDGSQSTDSEGDPLTYAWDLDNDGLFDDSTQVAPTWTFSTIGSKTVRLRVSDGVASNTDTITVVVTNNHCPTAIINSPPDGSLAAIGQTITFSGSGTDIQDGTLGASAFLWQLLGNHCETPTECHLHFQQSFTGITTGSFQYPDHELPFFLTIKLTVTDSGGRTGTASVDINPQAGGGPPPPPPPPGTFADVPPGHSFFTEIGWLAATGITKGCSTSTFCPDDPVSRGQMAAFLTRALQLIPPSGVDPFTDDGSSGFEPEIEAIHSTGITLGCSPTIYCPEDPVTRGQMAAFLTRALRLPIPVGVDTFTDDEGSGFEPEIEALFAAGVTRGCGPGSFCPEQPVTRGQMAAFLYRALSGNA